jgi:hypothetical protein
LLLCRGRLDWCEISFGTLVAPWSLHCSKNQHYHALPFLFFCVAATTIKITLMDSNFAVWRRSESRHGCSKHAKKQVQT